MCSESPYSVGWEEICCETTGRKPGKARKANWDTFGETCISGLDNVSDESVEVLGSSLYFLLSAATEAAAGKAALWPRKVVPWWHKTYDEAVRARNRAYRRLWNFPVESNVLIYPRLRSVARRVNKS